MSMNRKTFVKSVAAALGLTGIGAAVGLGSVAPEKVLTPKKGCKNGLLTPTEVTRMALEDMKESFPEMFHHKQDMDFAIGSKWDERMMHKITVRRPVKYEISRINTHPIT